MAIPFNEKIVNDSELTSRNFYNRKFIGFIDSLGNEFNYANPFGLGGHDSNPITGLFGYYFIFRENPGFFGGAKIFDKDEEKRDEDKTKRLLNKCEKELNGLINCEKRYKEMRSHPINWYAENDIPGPEFWHLDKYELLTKEVLKFLEIVMPMDCLTSAWEKLFD